MRIFGKELLAVLVCGATLATQSVVLAQGAMKGPSGRPGMAGQPSPNPLNLTDAQKTKLKAMYQAIIPQLMALQSNTTMPPAQKQMKAMAIQKSLQVQMETVLTPAQKVKFKQMQKQAEARRAAMMKQQQSMMHNGTAGKPGKTH